MLTITLLSAWAFFSTYLLWYATSAKRNVPITANDAEILWKLHKKTTNCACHNWHLIKRRNSNISGFECECGYKYTQKRPLISNVPKNSSQNARIAEQQQRMLSSGYVYPEQ